MVGHSRIDQIFWAYFRLHWRTNRLNSVAIFSFFTAFLMASVAWPTSVSISANGFLGNAFSSCCRCSVQLHIYSILRANFTFQRLPFSKLLADTTNSTSFNVFNSVWSLHSAGCFGLALARLSCESALTIVRTVKNRRSSCRSSGSNRGWDRQIVNSLMFKFNRMLIPP